MTLHIDRLKNGILADIAPPCPPSVRHPALPLDNALCAPSTSPGDPVRNNVKWDCWCLLQVLVQGESYLCSGVAVDLSSELHITAFTPLASRDTVGHIPICQISWNISPRMSKPIQVHHLMVIGCSSPVSGLATNLWNCGGRWEGILKTLHNSSTPQFSQPWRGGPWVSRFNLSGRHSQPGNFQLSWLWLWPWTFLGSLHVEPRCWRVPNATQRLPCRWRQQHGSALGSAGGKTWFVFHDVFYIFVSWPSSNFTNTKLLSIWQEP